MAEEGMIERMARALCDNQESHELNWEAWVHAVRAILREMRKPTSEMIGDVHDTLLYHAKGNELDTAKLVWERMIEVALDEGRD